jgi:hypothetical protein
MPVAKRSTKSEETVVAPSAEKVTKSSSTTKSDKPVAESKSSSTKSDKPMPVKKSSSTKVEAPAAVAPEAAAQPKTPRKAKAVAEVPVKAEASKEEDAAEVVLPKKRRSPQKESLNENFSTLEVKVEGIIDELRKSGLKNVGIANWKSVLKTIKQLHIDSNRLTKVKKLNKTSNTNGGFHKSVLINPELSRFCASHALEVAKACKVLLEKNVIKSDKYTEWKPSDWVDGEHTTRSKVTKFLCDYVKAKNLQKEENRREFKVDSDMKDLFKLKFDDKDNNGKPIDYCNLQKLVKPFYITEVAESK